MHELFLELTDPLFQIWLTAKCDAYVTQSGTSLGDRLLGVIAGLVKRACSISGNKMRGLTNSVGVIVLSSFHIQHSLCGMRCDERELGVALPFGRGVSDGSANSYGKLARQPEAVCPPRRGLQGRMSWPWPVQNMIQALVGLFKIHLC